MSPQVLANVKRFASPVLDAARHPRPYLSLKMFSLGKYFQQERQISGAQVSSFIKSR